MDKLDENPAAAVIANMALAHEMIMTDNFQLKPISEMKKNSLVKNVHDIVHNAFWDVLKSEVTLDPPQYRSALKLLIEMKQIILEIIPVANEKLIKNIKEVLDEDFIEQEVAHGVFDLHTCAMYIINVLAKLCAPVRDEKIKEIKDETELIPLLRGTFELLDLMKMDMVNYEIQSIKPVLLKQATEYERGKFDEYLKQNPDGLANTRSWLKGAYESIKSLHTSPTRNIRGVIVTHAYLSLIETENKMIFPETLLLDEGRIETLAVSYNNLIYIASMIALYNAYAGDHLTTDTEYMSQLKDTMFILVGENKCTEEILLNVSEQVLLETEKQYELRGIHKKSDEDKDVIRRQFKDLMKEDNQLKQLIKSRVRDYLLLSFTSQTRPLPTSSVLLPIKNEVKRATDLFVRVIVHNRNVHLNSYNEILNDFLSSNRSNEIEKKT